jgi:FixJ family two-component response regulator
VATLTQKQKIILKHIDGMSNRSIAKELHMSKDTVNKYILENEYEPIILGAIKEITGKVYSIEYCR